MATAHLTELHRSLGIPADYGAARYLRAFREADADRLILVGHDPTEGKPVRLARRCSSVANSPPVARSTTFSATSPRPASANTIPDARSILALLKT